MTAQRLHPNRSIYASKIDFKSAYPQCHLSASTAIQCCTQLPLIDVDDNILLMYIQETFGGSPSPNEWGALAEPVCDLANAILHDNDWDPHTLHLPIQHLVPSSITLDDSVPFGEAKELIVAIQIDSRGINDIYVDDIVPPTCRVQTTCHDAQVLRYLQSMQRHAKITKMTRHLENSWKVVTSL